MTPSQLKSKYLAANPDGKFFSTINMRFSGDTMSNYGVRSPQFAYAIEQGAVYELYRKSPVGTDRFKTKSSAYFDAKFNYITCHAHLSRNPLEEATKP